MLFNSSQIAELTARVATLEADLSAAHTARGNFETQLAEAQAALTAAGSTIAGLQESLIAANATADAAIIARNEATARAEAAEASIDSQVTERLASAGVDILNRDTQAAENAETKPSVGSGLTGAAKARALLAAKMAENKLAVA